jgi:hypothetical protein
MILRAVWNDSAFAARFTDLFAARLRWGKDFFLAALDRLRFLGLAMLCFP